jgi:tetratricopeptide (TPR) repeat protein
VALLCFSYSGCRSTEQILFAQGEKEIQRLDYEAAYDTFTSYLVLDSTSSAGYFNRGLAATGLDRLMEGLQDFEQAVLLGPGNTDARWMRYRIRQQLLETERDSSGMGFPRRSLHQTMASALIALMLEDLSMLLKIDDQDVSAWYERGVLLRSLGRREEAQRDLDIALLNAPWDIWVRNEHGRLMHDLGDYDAAVDDYDAALAVCDTCTWLLYNKALSLKAGGQIQQAAETIGELVAVDSLDGEAWFMLAECDILLGRKRDACAALLRSSELGVTEAWERYKEICR